MYVNMKSMRVKQVDVLLDLLEAFAASGEPMNLTALASALGQPKSSCFNTIETLRMRGYLYEVKPRGGFYPTQKLRRLAERIDQGDPTSAVLHDAVLKLAEAAGETALLAVRDRDHVTYVDVVESPLPVRYFAQIGDRRPVYATSGGKAILSTWVGKDLEREVASLSFQEGTECTIRTAEALTADIDSRRNSGWFVNASEFTADVTGIGVPLIVNGRRFGLSVAGPNYRMKDRLEEIAVVVRACAQEAEERIAAR